MKQLEITFPQSEEKADAQPLSLNVSPSGGTASGEVVQERRKRLAERFWSKVNKNGPIPPHQSHLGQCWEYTGCRNEHGYGDVCTNGERKRHDKAHRVSWLLTHGELPDQSVLHKCDNPPCVRPDHLFLGNHKTNADDMVKKGRARNKTFKGELNGFSKLTWENVRKIRQLWNEGTIRNKTEIGRMFGVSKQPIIKILQNKAWIE